MNISDEVSKQPENTQSDSTPSVQPTETTPPLKARNDESDKIAITISSVDKNDKDVKHSVDSKATPAKEANQNLLDDDTGDDFVMVPAAKQVPVLEPNRNSIFASMESYFVKQIAMCDYYKNVFEKQENIALATKFITYSTSSIKHLELLRFCWKNNEPLPNYRFEQLYFSCLPVNFDIKEKELQITIKTQNLTSSPSAATYIIGEFDFSTPSDEPITAYLARWIHYVTIEPKKMLCCSSEESRQLDIVHSNDQVLFTDPEGRYKSYDRPLNFFVHKGKSKTLKRKFKPIKLTFYEKTGIFACDKRLGTILVRIDDINDDSTISTKLPIMHCRKQTQATADIKVQVREPLVNKTIRAHEESVLLLI